MTTDTVPKTAAVARRRLDGRRHGQGRRHARPRPGHDAVRAHHRRRGDRRRCDAALRAATARSPSTGSTPTAACPPTTPCCCWPAAPPGVSPDRRPSFDRGGHERPAPTWPAAARRRRGRDQGDRHRGAPARRARTTRSRSAAPSPATTWSRRALFGNDPNWGRILAAVGTTAAAFEPDALDVAINGVWVCRGGAAGEDRVQGRPDRAGRAHPGRPARRPAGRDGLDQRPVHAYVHENSAYST